MGAADPAFVKLGDFDAQLAAVRDRILDSEDDLHDAEREVTSATAHFEKTGGQTEAWAAVEKARGAMDRAQTLIAAGRALERQLVAQREVSRCAQLKAEIEVLAKQVSGEAYRARIAPHCLRIAAIERELSREISAVNAAHEAHEDLARRKSYLDDVLHGRVSAPRQPPPVYIPILVTRIAAARLQSGAGETTRDSASPNGLAYKNTPMWITPVGKYELNSILGGERLSSWIDALVDEVVGEAARAAAPRESEAAE